MPYGVHLACSRDKRRPRFLLHLFPSSPAPNDSPVITLSPTTITAHVVAQELPPSFSNTPTATPKRAPPSPPAPLSVPTTPFDYDATFNDTGATPTPRPDTSAPTPPASAAPTRTTDPQTSSSAPEEESEVERVLVPTPSPETKVDPKAKEPKVDKPKVDELKKETKENPETRRPPSLNLLHEHDPCADAPSSSKPERQSVMGGTVYAVTVGRFGIVGVMSFGSGASGGGGGGLGSVIHRCAFSRTSSPTESRGAALSAWGAAITA
ncbi:hypothetical protein DXG01_011266 [Tephrocybe rancida]|nr:hypothetical protein DXG01_011266 [Tephrocybe rancida]